jgi:hypothetical protein
MPNDPEPPASTGDPRALVAGVDVGTLAGRALHDHVGRGAEDVAHRPPGPVPVSRQLGTPGRLTAADVTSLHERDQNVDGQVQS